MTSTLTSLLHPPAALVPPRWARGGHIQTLLGHFLPSGGVDLALHAAAERVELDLGDGDRLVGFFHPGSEPKRPIVAFFHGLSGDTGSDYMRRAVQAAMQAGYGVLAMNHRGCGAGVGLAQRPYHSGCASDLSHALAWCRAQHPQRALYAVGFSLSGNALLLLLAGRGLCLPDAAVAVNPPIDLEYTSHAMNIGLSRLYELRFIRRLLRQLRSRVRAGHIPEGRYKISSRASLHSFDEQYTAPAGGFQNALDYYRKCSAGPRLHDISTPTVVISSRDDPLVGVETFERVQASPSVHLHIEDHGGHLGYVSTAASAGLAGRWIDSALVHYLGELQRVSHTEPRIEIRS
ncbi:MAG: putative alpha/beta-fold hydrolase [Planctomycetota bacterium]|jgi:predicted alpha/beta-fold hydrolase